MSDVLPVPSCDGNTVAMWSFADGAGSTIDDSCGALDGTVSNGTWAPGLFGQSAYVFNGTSTVGSTPDSSAFNMPSFTIEAYVSRAGYNPHYGGGYQLVAGKMPTRPAINLCSVSTMIGWMLKLLFRQHQ